MLNDVVILPAKGPPQVTYTYSWPRNQLSRQNRCKRHAHLNSIQGKESANWLASIAKMSLRGTKLANHMYDMTELKQ